VHQLLTNDSIILTKRDSNVDHNQLYYMCINVSIDDDDDGGGSRSGENDRTISICC